MSEGSKDVAFMGPYGPVLGMTHRYAYLSVAIILGTICLASTIITFVLAKTHNDLKQRGRYLVFWNGLSATIVITVYLMLNAFVGDFPCFILLWTWRLVYIYNQQVNVGQRTLQLSGAIELTELRPESNRDVSIGSSTAQGASAAGTAAGSASTHLDISSLSMGLGHCTKSSGQPPQGVQAVAGSRAAKEVRQQNGGEDSAVAGIDATLTPSQTHPARRKLDAPLPPLPSTKKSTLLPLPTENTPSIHNIVSSAIISLPPAAAISSRIPMSSQSGEPSEPSRTLSSPVSVGVFPECNDIVLATCTTLDNADAISNCTGFRNSTCGWPTSAMTFDTAPPEARYRWSRFLPFNQATDGRLTVFLMACMVIPLVLCIGVQFVKPSSVQVNPTSYKCGEGPVFYPIYSLMLIFLVIACPILVHKLRWVKDGFGIRNELLMAVCIGTPGFVLYFISPFYLSNLDAGHWNHVNWLVLTIFLSHVNSMVLPLIQFLMRQTPRQRTNSFKASQNQFASIHRWDSVKSFPGTPSMDVSNGASLFLFRTHTTSSQVIPPQQSPLEQADSGLSERQSLGQQNLDSMNNPVPVNYSATTGQRLRGIKGFWAKYGKHPNGSIIQLSEMCPRAFEYALQDPEMLTELVKFSVTVFSAENTKFLQEYDGLRKQVREYFRLVGHRNRDASKHHQSEVADSTITNTGDGAALGSVRSSRPSWKEKTSLISSVASSLHNRFSARGSGPADDGEGSVRASRHGSMVGSVLEASEGPIPEGRDPGSSTAVPPPSPFPVRSFGKHRQDLRESLWRLSLQPARRQPNTSSVAPCGSVPAETDAKDECSKNRRSHSAPSPLSFPRHEPERAARQQKPSQNGRTYYREATMGTVDGANDPKNGSGENESERSSFSWYGRGNTGSTLSYHDVTPSEASSYHDTASEGPYLHSRCFVGGYSDSMADSRHEGDHSPIMTRESMEADTRNGEEKPEAGAGAGSCPTGVSAYALRSGERTPISPRHQSSHSTSSSPIGSVGSDGVRDGMVAFAHPRQLSRLSQPVGSSPFHSPNSSVSAPFTPRLPSQPQLHSPSTIRSSQLAIPNSIPTRSIMTGEEHRQLCNMASSTSSTTPAGPSNVLPMHQHPSHSPLQSQAPSQTPSQPMQQQSSTTSAVRQSHTLSRPSISRGCSQAMSMHVQRTPVPAALLSAYWEISNTFIMPNSILELNLTEVQVDEVRQLFGTNDCYLEMYESIVKEVQELVYSNVWPRFVQSIQRQPQGLPGKFKRTWKALFGKGPEDQEDEVYRRASGIREEGFSSKGRRDRGDRSSNFGGGSPSQDMLQNPQQEQHQLDDGSGFEGYMLAQPQASYIHGQPAYLGGDLGDPGVIQLRGRLLNDGNDGRDPYEIPDLNQFGVMQELDFSALQRIVVDPK
ncbi:hypothetical protein BG011_001070 [Mortierella polycephala]|uniref:RGS domain-containing protein n=1 Tax=Mortierella polycephala TaxID=41804 RepID=A0A9P6Q9U6_9FUNG|nr:hypothetical protein BG011_001070 [Mortierella polycephala]